MNKMKLQLIAVALMALSTSTFAGTSDGPSVGVGIGQYSGIGAYSQGANLGKDIYESEAKTKDCCVNADPDDLGVWGGK